MKVRLLATVGALCLFVLLVSALAIVTGYHETRLILSGPRRDLAAAEIAPTTGGWISAFGCIRHDLAAQVTTTGQAFRLGTHPTDADSGDRVFTPLAAHDDCDENQPPRRIFALVEDDDALSNSLGQVLKVAPPPVPGMVDGVIGFGAGHARLASRARAFLGAQVGEVPLIVKGKHPGVMWVAAATLAAGVHGILLLGLIGWWWRRRIRRARNPEDHLEEQFFGTR